MADLHIGGGQPYADFTTAYAASSVGDTYVFHVGTHTVSAQVGKSDQTVTTAGDGDVVLDAGGSSYVFRVWGAHRLTIGEATGDTLRLQGSSSHVIDHYQGNGMTLDGVTVKVTGSTAYCVALGGAGGGGTGTFTFDNVRLRGKEDGSTPSGRGIWVQTYYPGSTFTGDSVDILGCAYGIYCRYAATWQRLNITGGAATKSGYGFYYSPDQWIKNSKFYNLDRALYNYNQGGYRLLNCTFDDNTKHIHTSGGIDGAWNCCWTNGVIYIYPSPRGFTNCLFWNTTGQASHTLTNCVTGTVDPYLSRATRDFHLFAGPPPSQAVDVGVDLSSVGWWQVVDDFDRVPRPQNGIYDIGAYEFPVSTGWAGKFCGASIAGVCGVPVASVCGG